MIEDGILSGKYMDKYLSELFSPLKNEHIDAIVLGCTHYPFVKKSIISYFNYDVKIYDGAHGTAKETKRKVTEYNIQNMSTNSGYIKLLTSGDRNKFNALAEKLLHTDF